MNAVIDWRYVRMSVTARQKLAEAIRQKRRECFKGAWIRYTDKTVNLLSAILERIDRKTGKARISFSVLMEVTPIASRETVVRHVFLLEQAGCVMVKRGERIGRHLNAINEFTLVGEVALSFLGDKWSPAGAKYRTDMGTMVVPNINKNMMDDSDIHSSTDDLLGKVKTILDEHIAKRCIAQYGEEMVKVWYEWVIHPEQSWANNLGGLLVTKLRSGQMPPTPKEKQVQKRKDKTVIRPPADWREYLVDEFGNAYDKTPIKRDVVAGGLSEARLNTLIFGWWREQPFMVGNHPTTMIVKVVSGVVIYSPTAWAKRGGRAVLRALLEGWYPNEKIVLMDDEEHASAHIVKLAV